MTQRPFALSLSKCSAHRSKGFDRLSPNGSFPIVLSLSKGKLSPNGD
jgi:hypothetical protein